MSIWAAVAGGAAILGLLGSGALLAVLSWRSIFGLNVLLSVLALTGTLRFVPESADPEAPRLDIGGALLAVAGLLVLVFSVIEAPDHGWLDGRTLAGFALAAVLLVGFVRWELSQESPLLDPRVFANRSLASGSTSIFIQFFAFYGFTFIVLQYLQLVRGASPLFAALQVLPLAATMMPMSRLAPRLTARFGTRSVCAVGLLLVGAGLAILAQLGTDTPYLQMAVGLLVLGTGMGAAMTPATSAITEALPSSQQGVGSALNDLSREVGGALGIAVIGSLLTGVYSSRVNVAGLPARLAGEVQGSFAIAAHLPAPIPARAHEAFTIGLNVALLTAAGAAFAAAVVVVVVLRRRRSVPAVASRVETATDAVSIRVGRAADSAVLK